jgi:hypothetical protein
VKSLAGPYLGPAFSANIAAPDALPADFKSFFIRSFSGLRLGLSAVSHPAFTPFRRASIASHNDHSCQGPWGRMDKEEAATEPRAGRNASPAALALVGGNHEQFAHVADLDLTPSEKP